MNVQDYCAREGARVFAAIYRAIKEHTLVPDEVAEGLAEASANAHTEVVARLLRERETTNRRAEVAIDARGV